LYAGNAAVVKVSEFANYSRAFYQDIFRKGTCTAFAVNNNQHGVWQMLIVSDVLGGGGG
jgi:hypothetical protein